MSDTELEHLIQMAGQIAANFSFHDDQLERTADHIKRFWAPSMRRLLADHIEQGGAGVSDEVVAAMRLIEQP